MPRVKDRLNGEANTPAIASCNRSRSDEHQHRHDRHVVLITPITGPTSLLHRFRVIDRHGHHLP